MANITVSLPEPEKEWVDAQVAKGEYASASDYVRELVVRDRARLTEEYSLDELRDLVAESRASGVGSRSMKELFSAAERIATKRGSVGE